ncbi:hypothetical protein O1L44_02630 [Streptomyces noursei]|uniref:hypothetical protein n=1 Tax=Streptomyces noursei TaxID=1971 RepID=UPI00081C50FE|nr:membrane protein [Streptomyces noursei ATCC 11455]MCZ0992257.1 hypothetical protein [Streptomyces noursei]
MTTPSSPASPPRTRTSILRDRRNWIAFVVGLAVVVTGAVLVWPRDGGHLPETPKDLCAFIGRDAIAKYVPSPKLSKPDADYTFCSADSPSGFYLGIHLNRWSKSPVKDFAKTCRRASSLAIDIDGRALKRSETAEFGDRMCGVIVHSEYQHEVFVHTVQGGDLIDIEYSIPPERQQDTLQNAVELTRLVLAKLR